MSSSYRVVSTSRFDRDYKVLAKRDPQAIPQIEAMVEALREDPSNVGRKYRVKKLKGVKRGEGQWRIASGDYRIRYDIFERDVVLYSCKLRRDIYRR